MTYELLPPRGAMHRDILKGSRLEIANAYAVGRLIDGQAIADAWNHLQALQQNGDYDSSVEEQRLADAIEDAITEETNNERETTRQELVNQIAGLLSTIEFRPSEGHPIALDSYADQVVSMCDARLRNDEDE